ncbi:MAG: glycosyltransferase family 9 protein, partial [Caldimonas sp.]
ADADFRRILVVCTRQIGDVLLTTPLIRATRRRWPDAAIDVLGFTGTLGMLKGNPDIHELIEAKGGSGWVASRALIGRLWRRYDLALIAQYSDRAHLYGWIAAPTRSGQVFAGVKGWWKRLLLQHIVTIDDRHEHAVTEKMHLLDPWVTPPTAALVPPRADALPEAVGAALRSPYVVVHVPSLVRYKQWPLEHYATLARALAGDGVQVVLSGGSSDADRRACAEVVERASGSGLLDLSGRLTLNQLATLLAGASAYVGPDTSITHLATACDVPVVALYGPISPRLWGPWPGGETGVAPFVDRAARQQARKVVVLQGPQPCVPCNGAGCDKHNDSRSLCLESLEPARVVDEVRRILAGSRVAA